LAHCCCLQGDTKVAALPTNTPLNFDSNSSGTSSSSNSSSGSSTDSLPLAVPAAAWWPLVLPDSGLDVLSCEHLGSSSNGSHHGGSNGSNGSSSSSSVFVALVDSDDAPDGEVVVIHAAAPGPSADAQQQPRMVSGMS
jgi:hypothetical protein